MDIVRSLPREAWKKAEKIGSRFPPLGTRLYIVKEDMRRLACQAGLLPRETEKPIGAVKTYTLTQRQEEAIANAKFNMAIHRKFRAAQACMRRFQQKKARFLDGCEDVFSRPHVSGSGKMLVDGGVSALAYPILGAARGIEKMNALTFEMPDGWRLRNERGILEKASHRARYVLAFTLGGASHLVGSAAFVLNAFVEAPIQIFTRSKNEKCLLRDPERAMRVIKAPIRFAPVRHLLAALGKF
jgi:hypothetical protein